ncbi:hypothetical protein TrST_g2926 [Triparma strigata]|uniref:LigT-like protein n=1 Tax=Triparma strigata TaxID=1606541 RepID=A0A9W7EX78_9STRA|nr:hypothetical protein TrST_g2926 [Triparma strigata]
MGHFIVFAGLLMILSQLPICGGFISSTITRKYLSSTAASCTPTPSPSPTPSPPLIYTSSCSMIPPSSSWPPLQSLRADLRDAGLYRWPPHVNLLYPFVPPQKFPQVSHLLSSKLKSFKPFRVQFNTFETFGTDKRGVLWLKPTYPDTPTETLTTLQSILSSTLPYCTHQLKNGVFTPHMTVSHFSSESAALSAGEEIEFEGVDFLVDRVYLMSRNGAGGQFKVGAEVVFGEEEPILHVEPKAFEGMPEEEFEWVAVERKELQQRRKRKQRRKNS